MWKWKNNVDMRWKPERSTCWRPGKYNSCWKANGSHRHKKKKLMWKWSDVKLLNLVAVRLFLGPPKSPRRRMFCKQMVDFVTVRYICSHMFLWQCFVILIIRIRLVNSYLFCFSSFRNLDFEFNTSQSHFQKPLRKFGTLGQLHKHTLHRKIHGKYWERVGVSCWLGPKA